jgi:hypothetical protein
VDPSENPKHCVHALLSAGLSEAAIVAELKAIDVDTSQPTINRIKRGKAKSIGFRLGMGLIKLRQRIAEQSAQG